MGFNLKIWFPGEESNTGLLWAGYGWFPLLVRIFLAISFVSWEQHMYKCKAFILKTDIRIKSVLNELHEALPEKNRVDMRNSAGLYSVRFFCRLSACRCNQFCPYITHEKRPKAWSVQKQWMINGSVFAFSNEKNPLRGFVVFTNEIVLENKCLKGP